MTFFDVHVNRVPYSGRLSYRQVEPIDTLNHPMLEVEESILEDLRVTTSGAEYLRHNQRMVNRVDCLELDDSYYVLQIADYDVDSITPFELKQNHPCLQGALLADPLRLPGRPDHPALRALGPHSHPGSPLTRRSRNRHARSRSAPGLTR